MSKFKNKEVVYIFEHNDIVYTRTENSVGSVSWANHDEQVNGTLHHTKLTSHHIKTTYFKKILGVEELEKMYLIFLRELKLERILKKKK
jgi:hypothetical protein